MQPESIEHDGVVAWSVLPAPWGPLHVATTATAVAALAVRSTDDEFLAGLARRGFETGPHRSAADDGARRLLSTIRRFLERYVADDPAALEDAADTPVDLRDRPAWDRAVLAAVRRIPAGSVMSYGGVARAIGRPGAARAVGGAVSRNPIGLMVPCHRVIAGDGSIGGYGGSWFGSREENLELKRSLLAHEGVHLPAKLRDWRDSWS